MIESLNRECFCIGADLDALQAWLHRDLVQHGLVRPVVETHPHLFSALPVPSIAAVPDRVRFSKWSPRV